MSSRTHIVDLGLMPREQLIEVAKKQASQIREKNMRISAMESFIESVTGASAEESLQRPPSSFSAVAGGGNTPVSSSFSFSGTSPVGAPPTSSAQMVELRQLLEQEQLHHTIRVSELEEQLRAQKAEYDALQTKVDAWKTKVMAAMTADQERIRQLESELANAALFGPAAAPAVMATAPKTDDDESESLNAQLRSQVASLTSELQNAQAALQQAQHQLDSSQQAHSASDSQVFGMTTPDRAAPNNQPTPSNAWSPGSPSTASTITDVSQIPAEILKEAVHAKLETWKERVKATMMEDKNRIEELEQQLASLQQETSIHVSSSAGNHSESEALRADVARLEEQLAAAQQEREAALSASAAERESESEALRADVARLEEQLAAAQQEREAALSAFAAERESESEALRADVARLEEQLAAAQQERDAATQMAAAETEKLTTWKERVKAAMVADYTRIDELEGEVAMLRQDSEIALSGALENYTAELSALRKKLLMSDDRATTAEGKEAEAKQRIAVLESEGAKLREEVQSLRADNETVRTSLRTAESERDASKVAMEAFRAKMDAWKVKVRAVVEDRERERDALQVRVNALEHELTAAQNDATVASAEAADAQVKVEELLTLLEAAERDAEKRREEAAEKAAEAVRVEDSCASELAIPAAETANRVELKGTGALPELPVLPDGDRLDLLLRECARLASENARMRRAVTELTRFRTTVMAEMRAARAAAQACS